MENGYFLPYSITKLEDLRYDGSKLSFNLVQYTYKPKILKYVQKDYQKRQFTIPNLQLVVNVCWNSIKR